MTSTPISDSQRKAARIAGFLLIATFATVVAANYGIADKLIASHDAGATARNILANEFLFRLNIAGFLLYGMGVMGLLVALYVVLKPVNPGLALVAAFSRLTFALMWLIGTLFLYSTLRVLNADYLQLFGAERVHALARFYIGGSFEAYYIGLPFFGLASVLCFYLFYKSRYIPRALAIVGTLSGAWCVVFALGFIIVPNFDKTVNLYVLDTPMALSEIALGVWLLFKGIRARDIPDPDRAVTRAQAMAA